MAVSPFHDLDALNRALAGKVTVAADHVSVDDPQEVRRELIDRLVETAVFGDGATQTAARWLIRAIAQALGAIPASIHDLYMAAGRGAYSNATAPAINIRGLTYDVARTVFRSAQATNTKIFLFEIARSEIGYTDQRPAEYASAVLAAAIKEGHQGPVFIQGDHFQADRKKFQADPAAEIRAVQDLAIEAINAGFYNIDIDASTLVDIDQEDLYEQQRNNFEQTAAILQAVRQHEPEGITISVGAEIGEVGGRNSTVEDLHAFMRGFREQLDRIKTETGQSLTGISKISVQTGTSHGGIVLPDGSIANVKVDFDVLAALSEAARSQYGLGGAVQHGASTLPEEAFSKFAEANAIEVHLATAFQNVIFDSASFPASLKARIYQWLAENRASERKPDQTDAQFYYSTRKRGFGPFKRELWDLPPETRDAIMAELAPRFELIMRELGVANRGELVDQHVTPVVMNTPAPAGLLAAIPS
jgi:fructose/tagatose bisphosphate aldolase